MPWTFPLHGILYLGQGEGLIDITDAMSAAAASITQLVFIGSLRKFAWWCPRHQCVHELHFWSAVHLPENTDEPLYIFEAFMSYELGLSDGWEEYMDEHSDSDDWEPLTVDGDWRAFIKFRQWQLDNGLAF